MRKIAFILLPVYSMFLFTSLLVYASDNSESSNYGQKMSDYEKYSLTIETDRVLDDYLDLVGQKTEGAYTLNISQKLFDGLSHVFIMGTEGTVVHRTDKDGNVVEKMAWTSNEEMSKEQFDNLKRYLDGKYPDYNHRIINPYESSSIGTTFIWVEPVKKMDIKAWIDGDNVGNVEWSAYGEYAGNIEHFKQLSSDINVEDDKDTTDKSKEEPDVTERPASDGGTAYFDGTVAETSEGKEANDEVPHVEPEYSLDESEVENTLPAARLAEQSFQEVLDEVKAENEGKKWGDDFARCDKMYRNIDKNLATLQNLIDNGKPIEELETLSQQLFGKKAVSTEELQAWIDNMRSYVLEVIGSEPAPYLEYLMSKMKMLSTVSGIIEPKHVEIVVEDMDAFLEELIVAPDTFGKIWAVTDLYAGATEFNESGFSFSWDSRGEFEIDVNAIENVRIVYDDNETIQEVQKLLNLLGYDCGTPDGVKGAKTDDAIISYKREHGFSENTDITQDFLEDLISEREAEETEKSKDIAEIVERLKRLPQHASVQAAGPVEQEGLIGYVVRYNENEINIMCNPDVDGKMRIAVIPSIVSKDTGSADYIDFLAFFVQAVDDSVTGYEAYSYVIQMHDDGAYVSNGITYEYDSDSGIMYVTY